jgi:hypothetical protein
LRRKYVPTPPPTSDQLWVTSQKSCDPCIASLILGSTQSTDERAWGRMRRKSVGQLYTSLDQRRGTHQKNHANLPFPSFGTPVA